MTDDMTNWKVAKSNELVKAGYTLTLNEQRLVLFCIAQIDSRKPISRIRAVTAAAFAKAYTIETRHAYEALEDATERLWNREVKTRFDDGRVEKIRWVSKATYDKGNGRVTVNFSPEILPFLTLLNERFTSYDLRYIANLSSTYAIRIYEYLKQYVKFRNSIKVSLADFKEMLELSDSYMRFANFKARILVPSVEQLNSYTDLYVEWDEVREKRSVVAIEFRFSKAEQRQLPLLPVVEDPDGQETS
jgi:plasmid replication initiation protein